MVPVLVHRPNDDLNVHITEGILEGHPRSAGVVGIGDDDEGMPFLILGQPPHYYGLVIGSFHDARGDEDISLRHSLPDGFLLHQFPIRSPDAGHLKP